MATHQAKRAAAVDAATSTPHRWSRVVAHEGLVAARDRALLGLTRRPAVVAIVGVPGLGKTTLLHEIVRTLGDGAIPTRWATGADVATESAGAYDPRTVLLVDDAERLGEEGLGTLIRSAGGPMIFAGAPALPTMLARHDVVATTIALQPLRPSAVRDFLSARAESGEASRDPFSDAAIVRLALQSRGNPRLLHELAEAALLRAESDGAPGVEARHVESSRTEHRTAPAALVDDAVDPTASTVVRSESVPSAAPAPRGRVRSKAAMLAVLCLVAAALGSWIILRRREVRTLPLAPLTVAARPAEPVGETTPSAGSPLNPPPPPLPVQAPTPEIGADPQADATPAPPLPIATASNGSAEMQALPVLPTGAFTVISIHFHAGSPRARKEAATLAASLRTDGYSVDDPDVTSGRESNGVGYLFAEDREAALALAKFAHRIVAYLPIVATRRTPGDRDAPPHPGAIQINLSGEETAHE